MLANNIAKNLIKNAPVGLVIVDSNNDVIFTNKYLQERTGFKAEELQGERFFKNFFPEEQTREFIKRKITDCFKRPFEDFQLDLRKKSGNIMPASLSSAGFIHNDEYVIVCVIHDMTGRDTYEKVIEAGYDNLQQVTIDLETAMKKITEQQEILKAYKIKMTRELEIATSVQHAIIPTEFPNNEKTDIWGTSIPGEKLGGDYFDIFNLDKNIYGILIADVAGHGVAASLLTTMLKAYFEYYTKQYKKPEDVFSQINVSLSSTLGDSGFFLTALCFHHLCQR